MVSEILCFMGARRSLKLPGNRRKSKGPRAPPTAIMRPVMDVEKTMEFILEQMAQFYVERAKTEALIQAERAKTEAQQQATLKLIKLGMRMIHRNNEQIKENNEQIK